MKKGKKLTFRKIKTSEEFYDCFTDPENLHNLIDDKKYSNKIVHMRGIMDEWQERVGDTGAIPEKEHLLNMWPNGIQPMTEKPDVSYNNNLIQLSCKTEGASIAYIICDHEINPNFDFGWQLYYKPIENNKNNILYIQSHRIGFKESEIIRIEL